MRTPSALPGACAARCRVAAPPGVMALQTPPPLATPPASPHARRTPRGAQKECAAAPPPPFGCPALALSIGMWSAHGARLRLLLAPRAFVLLVDRTAAAEPPRATATAAVERLWSKTVERLPVSPFTLPKPADEAREAAAPHAAAERGGAAPQPAAPSVLAFEVDHCHVTGMAYVNPLLLPGRLVLEAAVLTRRAFATPGEALEFYAQHTQLRAASPPPRTPPPRAASAPPGGIGGGAHAAAQAAPPGAPAAGRTAAAPPTRTLRSKTVVVRFDDPHLPAALRRAMLADTRLLRLVESGLPEWAVFLPAYGLLYRRWMRQCAKAAWVALGVLSFAAGFYDLYRNIPGAKHALAAIYHVSGVPEFFDWLERNAHVRLSLLATYLLSESVVLEAALRHGARAASLARAAASALLTPARAAASALGAPLALLRASIAALWLAFAAAARAFAALGAPLLRLALALAPSGGGAPGAAAPVVAAARDGCAALWRGSRPVLAFSAHCALRLNAHRVSIQRELEARAAALHARLLGLPPPADEADADADDGASDAPLSPAASSQPDDVVSPPRAAAPAAAERGAGDGAVDASEYVLARAASPWPDARAARCKED